MPLLKVLCYTCAFPPDNNTHSGTFPGHDVDRLAVCLVGVDTKETWWRRFCQLTSSTHLVSDVSSVVGDRPKQMSTVNPVHFVVKKLHVTKFFLLTV